VNWAIFLRVVLGLHSTWLVNSATHMWGRRRFATKDDSRNTWWVAMLTFRRRLGTTTHTRTDVGAPRPRLVRVRRHLDRAQGPEGDWAGLGCPRRSNQPGDRGEVAA